MNRTIAILVALMGLLSFAAFSGCRHSHGQDSHSHNGRHHHSHAQGISHSDHQHDHALFHPAFDPAAPCTCAVTPIANGWCRKCNVGHVAGLRIESAMLFETLDAHGHDFLLESLQCQDCRRAVGDNSFCGKCGAGFVNNLAHFTRLTHALAFGKPVVPAQVTCATCRGHLGGTGWCAKCRRGLVGNVAFTDRTAYERAVPEFDILVAAIARSSQCDVCASAMVTHRSCPLCDISYESAGEIPQHSAPASTSPLQ